MPVENPYNFLKKQPNMKKAGIIGIAIAIIIAGGLGIYAVSNTEVPLGNDASMEFDEQVTATVEEGLVEEGDEFGFEEEATATVEEDLGEEEGSDLGFEDSASATVVNP